MLRHPLSLLLLVIIAIASISGCNRASAASGPLPKPAVDEKPSTNGKETAVFAGGCFWGVQAVFQHVKGVIGATSGYAGGSAKTAEYETVSTGRTGHAESVQVEFDPTQVSYGQLLEVFFSVAHDPTELNRQGPDEGTQYRSVVFYTSGEQKRIAEAYIAQLTAAKAFRNPIVTEVVPLTAFYRAEQYHQNYATLHPNNPYIMNNDAPKVANLKKELPELYK